MVVNSIFADRRRHTNGVRGSMRLIRARSTRRIGPSRIVIHDCTMAETGRVDRRFAEHFSVRYARAVASVRSVGLSGHLAWRMPMLLPASWEPIGSNIKEIYELGLTVNLAQRAIWAFSRFVPRELVRRVVDSSISTELGGFTAIAESSDPDALMHQMSRYFAELTEVFLAEEGMLDKFTDDAVMVFWNARNLQRDRVERACRAALAGKVASEQLNAEFETEGLQPFFKRFCVRVGDAVVGNLGSSERMNYTALGSAANPASRLEGLNKQYGTTILASGDVHRRVHEYFRFKEIGSVIVKGMSSETVVYEPTGAFP